MDKLEKEYLYYKRLFNNSQYDPPKEIKELGDLLIYRRLKEKLDGLDIERLAAALVIELENIYTALHKL